MVWWRRPQIRNFGDELNPLIWSHFIPEIANHKQSLFIGIGTILLEDQFPQSADIPKIIFSTGVGYGFPPNIDDSWRFYCVRGPLTADTLGLERDYAITDGAVLLRRMLHPENIEKTHRFGFMPHHKSADMSGNNWHRVCEQTGVLYIDPHRPINEVIRAILAVDVVIAEAMHGAIVADTFRIPWIPVITGQQIQQFKWLDWCASINVDYRPAYIPPPYAALEHRRNTAQRPFERIIEETELSMRAAFTNKPCISEEAKLETLTQRMEEKLQVLREDFRNGLIKPSQINTSM